MLTIVLELALKAFKTQDMSGAVYVVIGFKRKLPSVVNMLQILLAQMCLSSANQNLVLGTPLSRGRGVYQGTSWVQWGGLRCTIPAAEGGGGKRFFVPWRQAGTEMVTNSHSCAQIGWNGKSVQGCFVDRLVLLPKRLGFFCMLFFLPWFHGCFLTFIPDWMRLGFDPCPPTCTFQLWRKLKRGVKEQEMGLSLPPVT